MNHREQLIEKAALTLYSGNAPLSLVQEAERLVDALLPQVSTVEELEALPVGAILLTPRGELVQSLRRFKGYPLYWFEFIEGAWRGGELQSDGLIFAARGPLTIVWQPEVDHG